MADGAVLDAVALGDREGDELLAGYALHEAVGDALIDGYALVHGSGDEGCADADWRERGVVALLAVFAASYPRVADGNG